MYDIAIIGGGPAGLSAGISLARQGFKTILFEKKTFPVDKACGEGIMPPGVAILKDLGVLAEIQNIESLSFNGIHYFSSDQQEVQADFLEGPGIAIRRPILSKALLNIASHTSGLSIEEKTEIKSLPNEARFLIGADGLHSPTRSRLGLKRSLGQTRRYGAVQHYASKPWSRKVQVYWKNGLEAYITPFGLDEIGVGFLWDKNRFQPSISGKNLADSFLTEFPVLQERLSGAHKIGPIQSMGPMYHAVRSPISHHTALIGDAAGYIDAITGEGISLGLKSALLLTECLSQNKDLSWYAQELKKSRRSYSLTTQSLLFFAKHEWLFNKMFGVLCRHPKVFQKFL